MKTILALIDFSDVTPTVMNHARHLARAFESEVSLFHVVAPDPVVGDFAAAPVPSDGYQEQKEQLFVLRDELAALGIRATAEQHVGPVVDTIIAHIRPLNPDLVIMGSHRHGALYDLLVGSVTKGIIRHAAWPVLLVPPGLAAQSQPILSRPVAVESSEATTQLLGDWGGAPVPA